MKVVHLSTSDLIGGAAIACKRIVDAQALNGIDAKLLVQKKVSSDPKVYSTTTNSLLKLQYNLRLLCDEGYIRLLTNQSRGRFTNPVIGTDLTYHPLIVSADIINLQWINGGFLSLDTINKIGTSGKHIFWTFHDMWAFTGGCHYVSDCQNYLTECSNCPSLRFSSKNDVSNRIFKRKKEIFDKLNLTIITTSRWLAGEASRSALLKKKKVFVIPTPIDSEIFKPTDSQSSRRLLDLPYDKKIILFGAMNLKDVRKGFKYLIEALRMLNNTNKLKDIEIAVFGKLDKKVLSCIPYKVNQLGQLKTENEIISAYNAADVFVAPSLEDNLPNTIMESLACGKPVVAFNIGGIPDMIDHLENGYLAQSRSVEDLANGINWYFDNPVNINKLSHNAREKVLKNHSQVLVAKKYEELYNSFIQN